jgi:hypothetical protein
LGDDKEFMDSELATAWLRHREKWLIDRIQVAVAAEVTIKQVSKTLNMTVLRGYNRKDYQMEHKDADLRTAMQGLLDHLDDNTDLQTAMEELLDLFFETDYDQNLLEWCERSQKLRGADMNGSRG